jgi:F-type H+-transporting ATPase subunit gamma
MVHAHTQRVALVVYTSNSSLCGGFNNNTIKMMLEVVAEYKAKGIDDIVIYPIGRKVEEKARKEGLTVAGSYTELADKPNAEGCRQIAHEVGEQFLKGQLSKVELIYHHFKSAGSQVLTRKTLLPIDLSTETIGEDNDRDLTSNVATAKAQEYLRRKQEDAANKNTIKGVKLNDDFIVEPDLNTVLNSLVPKLLRLMVYTALLDSVASEHAARMVAMQTATDNADELLRTLNLEYNKSRQAAITNELLDLAGGAQE